MISARNITNKNQKGFTLIELLVVIGILAVLLAIVLVAINPARQFQQANDTKRRSDVTAILNAIGQYSADNKGNLSALSLSTTPVDAYTLCSSLVPTYISLIPTDPTSSFNGNGVDCTQAAGSLTGYKVTADANGRVTVYANNTQLATPTISVER